MLALVCTFRRFLIISSLHFTGEQLGALVKCRFLWALPLVGIGEADTLVDQLKRDTGMQPIQPTQDLDAQLKNLAILLGEEAVKVRFANFFLETTVGGSVKIGPNRAVPTKEEAAKMIFTDLAEYTPPLIGMDPFQLIFTLMSCKTRFLVKLMSLEDSRAYQ